MDRQQAQTHSRAYITITPRANHHTHARRSSYQLARADKERVGSGERGEGGDLAFGDCVRDRLSSS
eukprot:575895-Pleurochrysis_carterae.AAC.1